MKNMHLTAAYHNSLRIAAQRILQQSRQLRVSVWNVSTLAVDQS